jgi:nitroreductase
MTTASEAPATTNDLWEAMYTQRAIREWEPRPVPRELLTRVVDAATRAPSGSNLQPWRFIVVDDDDVRGQIAAAVRGRYEENERLKTMVETGAKADDRSYRLMLSGAQRLFTRLDRAPVLIVPCIYQIASPTPDPQSLLAGSSIYQAVQNLLLAARALGLAGVMTTIQAQIGPELRSILALPEDATPAALIPLGYPAGHFGPTKRKPVEEVLMWNGWAT